MYVYGLPTYSVSTCTRVLFAGAQNLLLLGVREYIHSTRTKLPVLKLIIFLARAELDTPLFFLIFQLIEVPKPLLC